MKKLMAMAMAGMMVLSMAACGSSSTDTTAERADSGSSRHDSGSSKRGRIHGSSDCWHG